MGFMVSMTGLQQTWISLPIQFCTWSTHSLSLESSLCSFPKAFFSRKQLWFWLLHILGFPLTLRLPFERFIEGPVRTPLEGSLTQTHCLASVAIWSYVSWLNYPFNLATFLPLPPKKMAISVDSLTCRLLLFHWTMSMWYADHGETLTWIFAFLEEGPSSVKAFVLKVDLVSKHEAWKEWDSALRTPFLLPQCSFPSVMLTLLTLTADVFLIRLNVPYL